MGHLCRRAGPLLMPATRADVVAESRSWVGTPYHLAADIKGVGVDCALILIKIFADLGLIEYFDPRPYSSDWFLHRSEEVYMGLVEARARRVERAAVQPGDVALLKIGRCFAHGGVVTVAEPLTMVHAYRRYGQVVEEVVSQNADVAERMESALFFSYWPSA